MTVFSRMVRRSISAALVVALCAAAVAWASTSKQRTPARSLKVSRLELSCDTSTGSVRASALTHLRVPGTARATRGRLVLSLRLSQDERTLAIVKQRLQMQRATSPTGLTQEVRFTDRESQPIFRAATGLSTCASGQSSKPLLITLTYTLRGTRVAQASRATRLVVTSDDKESGPGGGDSDVTQPVTEGDWCDALVSHAPPSVASDQITEASGLVASRRHANVFWTHNDSGDSARLFALGDRGQTLGSYALSGATNQDWEDIAIGGDYIYVGDVGDNNATRNRVTVYRVAEPSDAPSDGSSHTLAPVQSQKLTYPDGAHDAETLVVDPLDESIYVITKREARSRIYRAQPSWDGSTMALDYLGQLTWGGAVAGDISSDGRLVALKGYLSIRMYDRDPGASLAATLMGEGRAVPYLPEPQGEALALCGNSGVYLTLSEGLHPILYAYGG